VKGRKTYHRGTEKSSETEEKNHHRHIAVIDIAAIARLGNSQSLFCRRFAQMGADG
jgi:hypothetical protein